MKSAANTHRSWHLPDEAHIATTAGAHPQKAGNDPGDSLLAAGVPPNAPPPSQALPLVPVRVMRSWPGKTKMPGVGPHPKGLKANTVETDPPQEDPGNAGEASRVMIPWMRCLTTWPQDGNETSRT